MKRFLLATLLCAIGHCAYGPIRMAMDCWTSSMFPSLTPMQVETFPLTIVASKTLMVPISCPTRPRLTCTATWSRASRTEPSRGSAICRGLTCMTIKSQASRAGFPGARQFTDLYSGWQSNHEPQRVESSQGLSNLQYLSLGGNQITSIESGAFQGLNNLFTLLLCAQ